MMRINSLLDLSLLAVPTDDFSNPTSGEFVSAVGFKEIAGSASPLIHNILCEFTLEA